MWSKEKLKQNYGFCLQGKIQLIFGEKKEEMITMVVEL